MASRSQVAGYARHWLDWNPRATEGELRNALTGRFLLQSPHGPAAAAAAGGALAGAAQSPEPSGVGCLAGLVLAPFVFAWRLVFPVPPTRPEDIDTVLAELRTTGRWPDAGSPDAEPGAAADGGG
ncbi:MAG: hypothetical protein ACRCZF_04925 [Gemmataceae bacterium]